MLFIFPVSASVRPISLFNCGFDIFDNVFPFPALEDHIYIGLAGEGYNPNSSTRMRKDAFGESRDLRTGRVATAAKAMLPRMPSKTLFGSNVATLLSVTRRVVNLDGCQRIQPWLTLGSKGSLSAPM
jgi:hypothetical protein